MPFHDPIVSQKLKTFSSLKSRLVQAKGKEMVLKTDRALFGCLVFVAQTRAVDIGKHKWYARQTLQDQVTVFDR